MGSSQFGIPALLALINDKKYKILSIYTKPPKPAGRGYTVQKTPINLIADKYNIECKTPIKLKDETLPECDLIIVVSYGLILPKSVIDHPKIAAINIHPSLLPRWRGASPIQYSLLNGDEITGVSIVKMTEKLDAGDIFMQKPMKIIKDEKYNKLHDRLANLSASMLIEVLDNIEEIHPYPQSEENITYANKLPNSVEVDFSQDVEVIIRQINVFSGVFTEILGKKIKIIEADYNKNCGLDHKIGRVLIQDRNIIINCKSGNIIPKIVQPLGKKQMDVKSFLNGIIKN
jgi:methionyl-tRNA formyltransferase